MSHHHHHHASKNLKIAFFLNLGFTIFEIIGGFYVNSVAIISDAVHDLGDSLSLGTAWFLEKKSQQKPDKQFSFGYARFSLLGALINSVVLILGSVFVIYSAVNRILEPESSDATGMIFFAVFGILINGYAAWKLSGGKSLNERVVSWHLLEDVLGWVAILIVAIVLEFKDIQYLDPALSLFITAYILWGIIGRLKETLFVFLQGTPKEIDILEIEKKILKIPNVKDLHHTHVWSLEGEHHVFSTHVKLVNVENFKHVADVKKKIHQVLKKYHFSHVTIETELDNEICLLLSE